MADEANSRGPRRGGPDFAVVGIGASAGGVQALLRFFETVRRRRASHLLLSCTFRLTMRAMRTT